MRNSLYSRRSADIPSSPVVPPGDNGHAPRWVILTVDDNPFVRTIIFQTLGRRFSLLSAGNGIEALDVLRSNPVDLLLTDIVMPRMDGFKLAGHVRERHPDLPIVFVSAHLDNETERQAKAISPHLIYKPFDICHLIETVDSLLSIPTG